MHIVIVEDESLAAEKLEGHIQSLIPDAKIKRNLESVEDAINWFLTNPSPDLIFMDIQLDDGTSFEIFDEINIEAPVIFTTAYDKYAIRAFKVNSIDYLLKPIDKQSLKIALEKFNKLFPNTQSFEEQVTKVVEQLSNKYKKRFFIKTGTRFKSVLLTKVCCFFVEERCTFLKTCDGKTYDLDYSLDHLQKLINPDYFFRINRNFLININCISEILGHSSTRLKLILTIEFNNEIIVSRDKVASFKKWLDR